MTYIISNYILCHFMLTGSGFKKLGRTLELEYMVLTDSTACVKLQHVYLMVFFSLLFTE